MISIRDADEDIGGRVGIHLDPAGPIEVHLRGREAEGIVAPGEEARALKAELMAKLGGLRDEERGEVAVVDFKYSAGRGGERERYRLQLAAYALAAARAFPGRTVRARLQFLRGGLAAADLTPSPAELDRFAAEAPRLALGAFRGEGEWRSPAELGRSEARCRAEGCGYLVRCFPAPPGRASPARAARPEPARAGAEVAPAAVPVRGAPAAEASAAAEVALAARGRRKVL